MPDTGKTREEELAERFPQVDRCFREVCDKYGLDMFALVFNAGMAGQAAAVLAQAQRKPELLHATSVLAQAFNALSNDYFRARNAAEPEHWTEAMVAQCDRDVQLAMAGRIQTPGNKIILDS